MARRSLAALLTALALACPGTAFAQSAGDDQYEDPFGSGGAGAGAARAGGHPGARAGSAPEAVPQAAPETAPAAQATPAPAAPASQGRQLPYTGVETGLVAAAGALLIGAGVTLRRRSPSR